MAVHLTRIYTRTGDDGTTGLSDFSRVPKTHPRLAAYADSEETNAALGVVLAVGAPPEELVAPLRQIQNDLFDVGADLATPLVAEPETRATEPAESAPRALRVTVEQVERLEGWCDTYNDRLEKLDSFILPGGTPAAAYLHVARTVCRRAERSTWQVIEAEPEATSTLPARYLNRLSDLLFILGRVANPGGDVRWVPGGPEAQR